MKKLIVTLAIAALAVPLGFAQQSHGKMKASEHPKPSATTTSPRARQTVELSSLPQATQDAITKAVGSGKLTRLVSVTKNGAVSYEARVTNGTKKSVMRFDANGNAI